MNSLFPALVPGAEGLENPPEAQPEALRRRMAEVWGLPLDSTVVVAGRDGAMALLERLGEARPIEVLDWPDPTWAKKPDPQALSERLQGADAPLIMLDQTWADMGSGELPDDLRTQPRLLRLRTLSGLYGLAGAPCGALVAPPELAERLRALAKTSPVPTPVVRLALVALSPSRLPAYEARLALIRAERDRLAAALAGVEGLTVMACQGPALRLDGQDLTPRLVRHGVAHQMTDAGLIVPLGEPALNDRLLAAFGLMADRPRRRAEVIRDTRETRITAVVDLDQAGDIRIETGVGFFDHMLDQIASHAGISLTLTCEGDLEIDPHHTIEDCALALGAALKQALGTRAGIGRFGFVLPMDETEAKVSIDLSGRPYCVYEASFAASHLGDYPTEMTAHVFRSLAESLGAAIHVTVSGINDHHKTEAGFKAFGRALRQAVRFEGGAVPSTKGVL